MTIQWVTGFLDFPAAGFEAGRDFWLGVTGVCAVAAAGLCGDFATLVPVTDDA